MSETSFSTRDIAFKQAVDELYASVALGPFKRADSGEKHVWAQCVSRMKISHCSTKDEASFVRAFVKFYEDNKEALDTPVFSDDHAAQDINDVFFQSTDRFPSPLDGLAADKLAALTDKARDTLALRGPVLYYSWTSPALASICLPVGEMYRAAVIAASEAGDDEKKSFLPMFCLYYTYAALFLATDKAPALAKNMEDVSDAAEASAPLGGPYGDHGNRTSYVSRGGTVAVRPSSSAAAPAADPMSALLGMFTGGGKAGDDAMSAFRDVSGVINGIVSKIQSDGSDDEASAMTGDLSKDMPAAISRIGAALQDSNVQETLQGSLSKMMASFGGLFAGAAAGQPQPSK